jgi:hypothetical protein
MFSVDGDNFQKFLLEFCLRFGEVDFAAGSGGVVGGVRATGLLGQKGSSSGVKLWSLPFLVLCVYVTLHYEVATKKYQYG